MICSSRGRYRTTLLVLLVLQLGFAVPSLSFKNFNIGTIAAHIPNESLDRIQATFLPDATQAVRQVLRKVIQETGLSKRVTMHTLRHSCATHLLETDTDIRIL